LFPLFLLILATACATGPGAQAPGQRPPWYCYRYEWKEGDRVDHSSSCSLDSNQCESNAAEARATNSYSTVETCRPVATPTCYALRTPTRDLSLCFTAADECAAAAKNEQDLAHPCAPF
jgi:hypothetical protein